MEENNQSSKIPQYPPQYSRSRRKSRWWIPVLVIGLVLVGFFIILAVIVSQFGSTFEKKPVDVTENSILYLTFSNGLPEYSQTNPFAIFGGSDNSGATFFETIRAIKNAKNDNRIKGIYINPAFGSSIGFAKSVEIYDALMDFKKSGKFIYSFLEVGDENSYYLVLPSDSIFMPTEGMLEMNGYGVSSIFLKDFFNKIGIFTLLYHPRAIILAFMSYIVMIYIRIVAMWSTPLEAPATILPLIDPMVSEIGVGRLMTKDLFFSGHTATIQLIFLCSVEKKWRNVFLILTLIVAACVLIQHVHYTVDVVAAPFFGYCSYLIAKSFFNKIIK